MGAFKSTGIKSIHQKICHLRKLNRRGACRAQFPLKDRVGASASDINDDIGTYPHRELLAAVTAL